MVDKTAAITNNPQGPGTAPILFENEIRPQLDTEQPRVLIEIARESIQDKETSSSSSFTLSRQEDDTARSTTTCQLCLLLANIL